MKNLFFISKLSALEYMRAVSDDFIYIHVALRSGSGLPDHEREFSIQLTFQDFIAYFTNKIFFISRQYTEFMISLCCCFLQVSECIDDFLRHACLRADLEIVSGAFG